MLIFITSLIILRKKSDYLRFRLLRYFANEIYIKKNDNRSNFYCFECNESFKTLINFYENLQPSIVHENTIYMF